MNLLFHDDKVIVTSEGFMKPFFNPGNPNAAVPIPPYLRDENTELLREMSSFALYGDRKKEIPQSVFYHDMWQVEQYRKDDLKEFFETVRKVVRVGQFLKVEERGEDILVYGYESHTLTWERPHQPKEGEVTAPANGKEASMMPTNRFVICSYVPKSDIERRVLTKHLKPKVAVAVLHCVIVGMEYRARQEKMYDHFRKKTPTKVREIYAPKEDVKEALRHLLLPLNKAYDMRKKASNQFAYTIGRSIKDNAKIHQTYRYSLKCDIKNFFDQCNWNLVKKYLKFIVPSDIMYDDEAISALKEMIINPDTGGVYQGSPVSGAITNAIMKPAAKYMMNVFDKEDMVISVYADDITVSSNEPIEKNKVIGRIRFVFEDLGLPFRLKPEKTKIVSRNGRKITGVRINHLDQLTIDRKKYRLLRAILHRISLGQEITMPQKTLVGHINFFKFIDESGKIAKLLEKYEDALQSKSIRVSSAAASAAPDPGSLESLFEEADE